MSLDEATVATLAHLARIRLDESQRAGMADELNNILGWVEQLGEVDTEGVPPMTSVAQQGLRRRTDEVADGHYPDRVLANAPEKASGFYAVPKVVE